VKLSASLPDGRVVREATSFLGKPPDPRSAESPDARKAREAFAGQAAKLQADLNAQTKRTKTLEKSVADMQKQLKDEQARRMLNQDGGK
jgi:uncharacterized protein YlxW (UPF0749 family)